MTIDMRGRDVAFVVIVALAASTAVFGACLFDGKILAVGDGLNEALPAFLSPWHLWNDNMLLGYPLYADPNQATFYPLRLLREVPGGYNLYVVS